jgi:hypothetical protein
LLKKVDETKDHWSRTLGFDKEDGNVAKGLLLDMLCGKKVCARHATFSRSPPRAYVCEDVMQVVVQASKRVMSEIATLIATRTHHFVTIRSVAPSNLKAIAALSHALKQMISVNFMMLTVAGNVSPIDLQQVLVGCKESSLRIILRR